MVDWTDWETGGVPPPFFALIAMAYLWLRGVLDGGKQPLMREQVWGTFAVGFIALALLLLFSHFDEGSLPEGTSNLLWVFFATGMAALALAGLKVAAGLETVSGPAGRAIPARTRLDRYWLGGVVTVSLALLGLAMGLSTLIARKVVAQLLGAVWGVISQMIIYLWFAISLILLPVAYLFALLFAPLEDRLAELPAEFRAELDEVFRPEELPEPGGQTVNVLDSLPDELRWAALAILIALIGLMFALALRRLISRPDREGIEEIRESVLSRDLLQDQLSELWRSLLTRLQRQPETPFDPFLFLDGEVPTRRVIRSVYQALLASAQERGMPRPRSQTPIEYQPELEQEWSAAQEALAPFPNGYVYARYALDPPATEHAQRVSRAWEQLKRAQTGQDSAGSEMENNNGS